MNDYPLYKTNLFSVSPITKRVYISAGESYQAYVDITNPVDATNTLHYEVSVVPYAVTDGDYTADFAHESDYTAITNWVTIEEPEGYIEPNKVKRVYYTIEVPEDAPGGGQYCALAVRSVPEEDENSSGVQIQDVLEITSVLYAQVDGEILRDGEILENEVPGLVFTKPITTTVLVKNEGNTHQDAMVSVAVYSVFTGEKIDVGGKTTTAEEGEDFGDSYFSEIIMPETSKYIFNEISEGLADLGVYRVVQTVSFADTKDTQEQIVVLCPGWFIGTVFLTIVCLMISIISLSRRRKRKKM